MSPITGNHDGRKDELSRELELALEIANANSTTPRKPIPSEIVQNLCNIIEAIFIHGLKDPFFLKGSKHSKYPEPNFWPFLSKFTSRSIISVISKIPLITSEIGRSRAWIRHLLNESSLLSHIAILTAEKLALSQFYHDHAFLRDLYQVSFLLELLQITNQLTIQAAINNGLLNVWTPSPLILAGLIPGTLTKIRSLAPADREPGCSPLSKDVSMPIRPPTTTGPLLLSPIQKEKCTPSSERFEMSPLSSRPSSFTRNDAQPRFFLSSTPNEDDLYRAMSPKPMGPLLVSRRSRRQRSSKSSSSMCNCSSSRCDLTSSDLSKSVPNVTLMRNQQSQTLESSFHKGERDSTLRRRHHSEASTSTNDLEDNLDMSFETPDRILNDVFDEDYAVSENYCSTGSISRIDGAVSPDTGCETQSDAEVDKQTMSHRAKWETNAVDIPGNDCERGVYNSSRPSCDVLSSLSLRMRSPSRDTADSGGSPENLRKMDDNPSTIASDDVTIMATNDQLHGFSICLKNAYERVKSTEDIVPDADDDVAVHIDFGSNAVWRKKSTLERFTRIPIQTGLDKQDQRCPICRSEIGPLFDVPFGTCALDKMSYCMDCMAMEDEYSIPAYVINSWDWTPRDISHRGRAFIDSHSDEPVFDIDELNPSLYNHIPPLNAVKKLRERLHIVSSYLLDCEKSNAQYFEQLFHPRQYLYSDIHRYSYRDLKNVRSGDLEQQLEPWLQSSIEHILSCYLCCKKGSTCPFCSKTEIIHPFNTDETEKCTGCSSVVHKECSQKELPCSKCVRRSRHKAFLKDS